MIGEKESPQTDPFSADEVTKAPSADRKEVDKAFAELKKEGAIVSPVGCKGKPAKKNV